MNDVQTFYVAHVYTESSSTQYLYNWDNMYWAANVFLAQLTNEGAPARQSLCSAAACPWSRAWAQFDYARGEHPVESEFLRKLMEVIIGLSGYPEPSNQLILQKT